MEKYKPLAREVIQLSETKLLSQLRFLTGAVTAVKYEAASQECRMATDGKVIYYDPRQVLLAFKEEKDSVAADLLHILFHCLMGHPFCRQSREQRIWNLACDIAAEGARIELFPLGKADQARKHQVDRICDYAKGSAAEVIYNYFLENEIHGEELAQLEQCLGRDSHHLWKTVLKRAGGGTPGGQIKAGENGASADDEDEQARSAGESDQREEAAAAKSRKRWQKAARQVQTELTLFNRRQGTQAGRLMSGLKSFLFEEVDYSRFLRIFGTENEVMKISDDEFDVIYYMYGLEKYGNIPLIEPLEYSNLNRIREFAIAIDTSGSVQGDIVQEFLRRTCLVLKQTNSFASRVNIYVIQCDSQIQSCVRITNLEELDRYIADLKLYGFGGTDFRPVFSYVEQLLTERRIQKLNGLLYFTDGVGTYPDKEPPYKTAFIFNRDDYLSPRVPQWAIKAVLTSDNIKLMKDGL